jgi:hypothetical protein
MTTPDWSVRFSNSSSITFSKCEQNLNKELFSGNIISEPSKYLNKDAGVEFIAVNQFGAFLEQSADLAVAWRDPTSGHIFGVKAHVPVQIFGIGTEPYYEVKWYNGHETKDWHKPCEQTKVFNFPDNLAFRVEVRAQCSHQTIQISVNVGNKA